MITNDEVLPNNQMAEKQVLSAMLLNEDTLFSQIADLTSEHFYSMIHAQIFTAIKTHKTKDLSVLSLHVSEPETLMEIAGMYADKDCSGSVDQLKDMLSRREGIKAILQATIALQNNFEVKADKILNEAQSKISRICIGDTRSQPEPVSAILPRVFDNMQAMHERRKNSSGFVDTGITKIDQNIVFDNSDLIVLGGRPSMGKSAFVSHIARHNAKKDKTVLFFSCEMSKEQECKRELFAEAGCNMAQYNLGFTCKRDLPKLSMAYNPLSERKIYIDSNRNSPASVMAKCNYVKAIAGLDLIIFDYLQISGSDQRYHSRAEEIGSLAREYKNIALHFNVPFILLSQLGRSVEDSDNKSKKPMMRHLKESGGIEEAANTVLFIYREYKYFPVEKPDSKNKSLIICAKQRDGEADLEIEMYSDLSIGKYADLEQSTGFDDNGADRY